MSYLKVISLVGYVLLCTVIVALVDGAEAFFGIAMIAAIIVACYMDHRYQKKKAIDPVKPEGAKVRKAYVRNSETEKDLAFLASKLHKAPLYFERAYVRDGKPKWDTVGCNKAHFSREEVLTYKLKTLSEDKQAQFIEIFC